MSCALVQLRLLGVVDVDEYMDSMSLSTSLQKVSMAALFTGAEKVLFGLNDVTGASSVVAGVNGEVVLSL